MEDLEQLLKVVINSNDSRKYDNTLKLLENIHMVDESIGEKELIASFYAEKAQAYYHLNNLKLCKKAFKNALKLQPNNPKAICYKAYTYNKGKSSKKAINILKKAILMFPTNIDLYIGLGNIYDDYKNLDKAIEVLKKGIKQNQQHSILLNTLGDKYRNKGSIEEAKINYELAIKYDKKSLYPYNGLGDILAQQGEHEKAINEFNKAINQSELNNVDYAIEPYYNRANSYYSIKEYQKSSQDYLSYLEKKYKLSKLELEKEFDNNYKPNISIDYYARRAWLQYLKLNLIESSEIYKNINELIIEIKAKLLFNGNYITHYTSLSAAKDLVLKGSCFRLSEGVFLNDTSEGRELFNFLDFHKISGSNINTVSETFSRKPFIGSFVPENVSNDLTLWRMYGKEKKEEGKGCSLTLNMKNLLITSNDKLIPKKENFTSMNTNEDFNFYRIAYRQNIAKPEFKVPSCIGVEIKLNTLMLELKSSLKQAEKDLTFDSIKLDIIELLNEITFLFKSADYQYENEIRLIVNGNGINKNIEYENSKRVYIELDKINPFLKRITLGPKVESADELASIFHYSLEKKNIQTEVIISHIPFK